jgi:hypothetical protein
MRPNLARAVARCRAVAADMGDRGANGVLIREKGAGGPSAASSAASRHIIEIAR